jgi:phosphate transport system permease protein
MRRPAGPSLDRRVRLLGRIGRLFHWFTGTVAAGFLALISAIVAILVLGSAASIRRFGLGFLVGQVWDPVHNIYGALPAIVGTLLTSALALLLAVPVAIGAAIFLSEIVPARVRETLTYVVDVAAAVPSVIYGLWAFLVLVPWMKTSFEPGLAATTGGRWAFSGEPFGLDILTASVVLGIMILPTVISVTREALQAVPQMQREAALSLGATRSETTRIAVLGPARPAIFGGVMLGLGRALGETIAVTMVIGNIFQLPNSLFSQGQTIASEIASEFPGAAPSEISSLVELGLILLGITIAVNGTARLLIWRVTRPTDRGRARTSGRRRFGRKAPRRLATHLAHAEERILRRADSAPSHAIPPAPAWRTRIAAGAARRIARRRAAHSVAVGVAVGCLALAFAPFADVLFTAVHFGGAAVVTPSFYTSEFPAACTRSSCELGGIGPAIQGTLILLGLASLIALPVGLFVGIYLSEYGRNPFARALSFLTEVMTGLPSILIGLFVFTVFLTFDRQYLNTAIAGSAALAVLMIPIVARITEESLKVVPAGVREAGLALGFPRHRVTLRVVLGCAKSALVTGMLLAMARAAGETAALLLTAGTSLYWFSGFHAPVAAITPYIFAYFQFSYANWQEDIWGAALVLLLIMLGISLLARLAIRRTSAALGAG